MCNIQEPPPPKTPQRPACPKKGISSPFHIQISVPGSPSSFTQQINVLRLQSYLWLPLWVVAAAAVSCCNNWAPCDSSRTTVFTLNPSWSVIQHAFFWEMRWRGETCGRRRTFLSSKVLNWMDSYPSVHNINFRLSDVASFRTLFELSVVPWKSRKPQLFAALDKGSRTRIIVQRCRSYRPAIQMQRPTDQSGACLQMGGTLACAHVRWPGH